jgi:spermidine synthase
MAQTLSALMGNTVLRYSITIGIYLASLGIGAMLSDKCEERDCADRLIRIETWLSVIGSLSVLIIWSLDVFHRFIGSTRFFFDHGFGNHFLPILFFILCHMVIFWIGILSGYEIPLLVGMSEAKKPTTMNYVLGINYFGSLLGAVLFPLLLLPKLNLFAVSYFTGLLNATACILLLMSKPSTRKFCYAPITGTVIVGILLLLVFSENTQRFFLKKLYYYQDVTSIGSVFDSFKGHPNIQEYRSRYQIIHIVNAPHSFRQRMIYARYSDKFKKEPGFPQDMWLFLNNRYQFASNMEEHYHEFFVHAPIQWAQPPEKVLVLGAGDGIVLRELLKYKEVKRIQIVDIDPQMLDLARNHPFLQKVNHKSFHDPRVNLIVHDAFTWLQSCDQKFDAIYLDFPDPTTYDLAKLYSLEFYSLVRQCVSEGGFVAADIPNGGYFWDEYYSTFHAAGFGHIKPFENLLENENKGILELEVELLDRYRAEQTDEYKRLRQKFKMLVTDTIEDLEHRFIFLKSKKQPIKTSFQDHGIPLYVLNEIRLKLTSNVQFPGTFKANRVNSIFRPTLPGLNFFSVNYPF